MRSVRSLRSASFDNDYHLGGLEYIPSVVPSIEYIHQRGDSIARKYSSTAISGYTQSKGVTAFDIIAQNDETLELPLIFYKGYVARLNGEDIQPSTSGNGLVQLSVRDTGHIEVYYGGTVMQKISYFVSLFSIIALCFYIAVSYRKNKRYSDQ